MARTTSPEDRDRAVALASQPGSSAAAVAREFGVSASTVRRWIATAPHADVQVEPDAADAEAEPCDGTPAGLHRRGRALWETLGETKGTAGGELALEACRLADRLDELDRIIAGKGVLNLLKFRLSPDWWDHEGEQHVHVTVGFQSVLAETRGQQAQFRSLLNELGVTKAGKAAAAPTPAHRPANVRDQLRERRERREQEA